MKRLVGGDLQLDLSPIEIEESVDGVTYTSITDKSVLDQLKNISSFIGKSGMMKTVWVKLLNGETDETVVTRGSLSTFDGVTFLIKVLLAGFVLTLSVEFTQAETEDHTPLDEWYIDTGDAKYILVSDAQLIASIIGTGEIENAKPIYCHPITMSKTDKFQLTCLIFNNEATAFTLDTFKAYIDRLKAANTVARIMTSGFYQIEAQTVIVSLIGAYADPIRYLVNGGDASDGTTVSIDKTAFNDLFPADTIFVDNVNKIN